MIASQEGEPPGTLEFGAALGSVFFVLGLCNDGIPYSGPVSFGHFGAGRAKKELVMNIFKLVLLSSLTFIFFGVLRAALFLYILMLPDSPLVGVAPNGDVRKGDAATNAAQETGVTPTSLTRNAFSSSYFSPV